MLLNYYEVLSEVQDIDGICVCSLIRFKVYSKMLMFNYHCSKKDVQFYLLFYPQLCHILKFEVSFNYICKYNFFPSFKWCFLNCPSYVCSVIWHNGIQTQSWMSVKKSIYKWRSGDLEENDIHSKRSQIYAGQNQGRFSVFHSYSTPLMNSQFCDIGNIRHPQISEVTTCNHHHDHHPN